VRSTWRTTEARSVVLLLAVLASGCAVQPKGDPEIKDISTVRYLCEDGTRLGIWFEPETAIVSENDGETMILPQKRAGSGIWYGTDKIDFRGKGQDATWSNGVQSPTECHVTDPAPKA
jgi:membrane-bound inhibitor of C-type lysozyme